METLIAAAGIIIVAIASIFAALFQAKKRGKSEGEAEHERYKAEQVESVLDDVKLANAARDAVGSDSGEYDRLRNKYDRDKDKVGRMHDI